MNKRVRIGIRRSTRFYGLLFVVFGLFVTFFDLRKGWVEAVPWSEAVWSAAFSFVGICGLGALVAVFSPKLIGRGLSLSQLAESTRRPRDSFAKKIHATNCSSEEEVKSPEQIEDQES